MNYCPFALPTVGKRVQNPILFDNKFTSLSSYKPNLPNSFISRRSHFSPFHPFTFSPFHLFTLSPFHPFNFSPFHPFTLSPFHPFTLSTFHPFNFSPFHLFTFSPLQVFSPYQTASASLISPSPFLSLFADFTSICLFLCILNKRFALISR